MNGWVNPIIDGTVQCWGCPVFDRLFQVISSAAAGVYRQFSLFCILIFCLILAFYILFSVWKNLRGGGTDPFYQKSIKPVLINSLFVFALLGLGLYLPRFISTITFEPVAQMTLTYTQSMVNTNDETVNQKVSYQPQRMDESGFFRPQLRDTIIMLMKTTITQFQSYMKLGIAIMDKAFSWGALTGIGALVKHIIMFFMGLYLVYQFFKIFIKFCFYFVDVIVAMTFFAFFLPLSVVMFAFKNSDGPEWIKSIGSSLGMGQIKNVINAVISLASAVITYTVIMVIIAKFFSVSGASTTDLMQMITSGQIFAGALSDDNLAAMTLTGSIVLVYVINFLADQITNVTKMVMGAFDIKEEKPALGEEMGNNMLKLTENIVKTVKDVGSAVISGGENKEEKKDEKKK